MAFTASTILTPNPSGLHLITLLSPSPLLLSNILSGRNLYYAGSRIQFEEIFTFKCVVTDSTIVDVDYEWYHPKKYLGTWEIADAYATFSHTGEDRGFIINEVTTIKRYSDYTVTQDPYIGDTRGPLISVEQCNLRLLPELKDYSGIPTLTYVPEKTQPLFAGLSSLSSPQLGDAVFNSKIGFFACKLAPGVAAVEASYVCDAINKVSNADPAYIQPHCSLPESDCATEFDVYIRSINNGQPIDSIPGFAFSSQAGCQAVFFPPPNPGVCIANTYLCNSGEVREFFSPPNE